MYRQGDVWLKKIDDADLSAAKKVSPEVGRVILARGEMTGHHHSLSAEVAALYVLATGMRILNVLRQAKLAHQEHGEISLSPGQYEVGRQREYNPTEVWNVQD